MATKMATKIIRCTKKQAGSFMTIDGKMAMYVGFS